MNNTINILSKSESVKQERRAKAQKMQDKIFDYMNNEDFIFAPFGDNPRFLIEGERFGSDKDIDGNRCIVPAEKEFEFNTYELDIMLDWANFINEDYPEFFDNEDEDLIAKINQYVKQQYKNCQRKFKFLASELDVLIDWSEYLDDDYSNALTKQENDLVAKLNKYTDTI